MVVTHIIFGIFFYVFKYFCLSSTRGPVVGDESERRDSNRRRASGSRAPLRLIPEAASGRRGTAWWNRAKPCVTLVLHCWHNLRARRCAFIVFMISQHIAVILITVFFPGVCFWFEYCHWPCWDERAQRRGLDKKDAANKTQRFVDAETGHVIERVQQLCPLPYNIRKMIQKCGELFANQNSSGSCGFSIISQSHSFSLLQKINPNKPNVWIYSVSFAYYL